ncbi:Fas-binding factor 1 -like protein [Halotydeus destructor]|nr:Fas-binding factor 1 -like protein [Halotydeus destructor]
MSRGGSNRSRSFLDDLISSDDLGPSDSRRGSAKSVRFREKDDDDILDSLAPSTSASPRKKDSNEAAKSSHDWLDSNVSTTKSSQGVARQGKADWLGLAEDNDTLVPEGRSAAGATSIKDASNSSSEPADWLASGLSARRQRPSKLQADEQDTSNVEVMESSSWNDTKKSSKDIKQPMAVDSTSEPVAAVRQGDSNRSSQISAQPQVVSISSHFTPSTSSVAISSLPTDSSPVILLLQTQVKMLEMEKSQLTQSFEQLKKNRDDEISVMRDLHAQQLQMTKDFLTRQESMISEEKERRINDIKSKLESSEREKEELRDKYNQRMESTTNEWHEEVERLKELHSESLKRLADQQAEDITRIRRIKEQEIEAITVLQSHGQSLEMLVSKWEINAEQIGQMHKDIILKQEEILKEKVIHVDQKDKRLTDLDANWLALKSQLDGEKDRHRDAQKKLIDLIEEQKAILMAEQRSFAEQRSILAAEKYALEAERKQHTRASESMREDFDKERAVFNQDRELLKVERDDFSVRTKQFDEKEKQWRTRHDKERDQVAKMVRNAEDERKMLKDERSQLEQAGLSLERELHRFELKKSLFDSEKSKLHDLAMTVKERAEEVERLSKFVDKERRQASHSMDSAERLKQDVDAKLDILEQRALECQRREEDIYKENARITAEWSVLKETKESVMCSICASSLNRSKFGPTQLPEMQLTPGMVSSMADQDFSRLDGGLLVWQISAQQDAASLAEETAFIRKLQTSTGMPKFNFH